MKAVTLLEAKAHLRILDNSEDTYIESLVDVAIAQAEEITSRNLLETTNEFYLTKYEGTFELPKSPLIAVEKIEYIVSGETTYTLMPVAFYDVDDSCEPAKVRFLQSVSLADVFKAIKVTYTAGYSAVDVIPKPIKQWILIRVATMYENREEIVMGISVKTIENDYNDYLISKYRVGRL